jgi:hypothetical protein
MHLVEAIYEFSANFPDTERFGLTSQIRRAAVSIASNRRRRGSSFKAGIPALSLDRPGLAVRIGYPIPDCDSIGFRTAITTVSDLTNRVFARITALLNALDKPKGAR